jgi:glycosyltransferase involved in cell wall biosynthesis
MGSPVSPTSLSIVVPMHDEQDGAAACVAWCVEEGEATTASGQIAAFEVVIVDDGSHDRTAERVLAAAGDDERVHLVRHDHNRGVGAAIRTAIDATEGDLVLYVDADLPVPAGTTELMLQTARSQRAQVVAAYREGPRSGGSPRRFLYSSIWNLLARTMLGLQERDLNFACKLLDGPLVRSFDLRSDGGGIDVELLLRAHEAGVVVVQRAVPHQERQTDRSTMASPANVARMVRELAVLRRGHRAAGAR